jgi:hypothetical protein
MLTFEHRNDHQIRYIRVCVDVSAGQDHVYALGFSWIDWDEESSLAAQAQQCIDELNELYPEGGSMLIKQALNKYYQMV